MAYGSVKAFTLIFSFGMKFGIPVVPIDSMNDCFLFILHNADFVFKKKKRRRKGETIAVIPTYTRDYRLSKVCGAEHAASCTQRVLNS